MQALQYDMFVERSSLSAEEAHIFRQEMRYVVDSADRVRRGLFARLSEQGKIIQRLILEIEELKGKKKPEIFSIPLEESLFGRKHG